MQNIITTINIGKIKKVNKKTILKRLSEINHPIVSRTDFLENVEFENITANSAIIYARQNVLHAEQPIPHSKRFTVNFDSNVVNFNEILGVTNENVILNFGTIINNRPETIVNEFIQRYELENLLTVDDLIITNLTSSSVLIESLNINYLLSINIIFISRYLSLRTFITNTNLGNLESNSKKNIIDRIEQLNNLNYHHGKNIRLEIRNITRSSAEILFSQTTNSSSSLHTFHSTENLDYNDVLRVSFSIKKINLSSVITNTDLGDIPDNSFQTIIREVIRRNPNSKLTINDLINLIEHRIIFYENTGEGRIQFYTEYLENTP
ncbi:hypothetical protein [Spiroplasma endosymbiont of Seladonia tumulorum]|uniref:hypothetical protein n=1 Tax=Spiroplasma endosymbiont of Seladonia tumulorum TaxID=3066321 RepID=UPI0030CBDF39